MKPLAKVYLGRGAPMGRQVWGRPITAVGKILLARVAIDSEGYDSGGAYWGVGAPLYWAEDSADECGYRAFVRAASRADAAQALGIPNALLRVPVFHRGGKLA